MCKKPFIMNRTSFHEQAYLSNDAEIERKATRQKNKEIFALAKKANALANKILYEISVEQSDIRKVILVGLFAKALFSYNASIILCEYGLEHDAVVVSRVFIEAIMKFFAIYHDDEYFNNFLKEDLYGLKKLKKRVEREKGGNHFSEGSIARINQAIEKHGVEEVGKPGTVKTRALAEKAGMVELYLSIYDRYSSYVHSDIKSLEPFNINEENQIIDIKPKHKEIKAITATNIDSLWRVLNLWNIDCNLRYEKEIKELENKVVIIFDDLNKER